MKNKSLQCKFEKIFFQNVLINLAFQSEMISCDISQSVF